MVSPHWWPQGDSNQILSVLDSHCRRMLYRKAFDIVGDYLSVINLPGELDDDDALLEVFFALEIGYDPDPESGWERKDGPTVTRTANLIMCWNIYHCNDSALRSAYAELLAAGGRPAISTPLDYPPKPVKYCLPEELIGGKSLVGNRNDLNAGYHKEGEYARLSADLRAAADARIASWRVARCTKLL